jgi:hypothetical protein
LAVVQKVQILENLYDFAICTACVLRFAFNFVSTLDTSVVVCFPTEIKHLHFPIRKTFRDAL